MPDLFDPSIVPGFQSPLPGAIHPIGPIPSLGAGGGGLGAPPPQLGGTSAFGPPPPVPAAAAPVPQPPLNPAENLSRWQSFSQRLRETPGSARAMMVLGAALLQPGSLQANLGKGMLAAQGILEDARVTGVEEGRAARTEGRQERELRISEEAEKRAAREGKEGLRLEDVRAKTLGRQVDVQNRQVAATEERNRLTDLRDAADEALKDSTIANRNRVARLADELKGVNRQQAEADVKLTEAQTESAIQNAARNKNLATRDQELESVLRAAVNFPALQDLTDPTELGTALAEVTRTYDAARRGAGGQAQPVLGRVPIKFIERLRSSPDRQDWRQNIDKEYGQGTSTLILTLTDEQVEQWKVSNAGQ